MSAFSISNSHKPSQAYLARTTGRQRKLKCDGYTPCQNCRSHGRTCVLQTEMARTGGGDAFKATSRDRIAQLEDEVGSLWAVVRELRAELGLKGGDEEQVRWFMCCWAGLGFVLFVHRGLEQGGRGFGRDSSVDVGGLAEGCVGLQKGWTLPLD